MTKVPPRERWPEPPPHSEAGTLLTEVIIATFQLNGRLMEVAQGLAAEGGITAAWWQVLGGVLDEPRTVADIGRRLAQHPWANRVGAEVGATNLKEALTTMRRLIAVLDDE